MSLSSNPPSGAPSAAEGALHLEPLLLKKAALVIRSVNHPLRQQLLRLLHQQGPLTVSELYTQLHLEQSVASQHLAFLRKEGFVVTERDGRFIYYWVNPVRLREVDHLCRQLIRL